MSGKRGAVVSAWLGEIGSLFLLVALVVVGLGCGGRSTPPNIIYIVIEDTNRFAYGIYGAHLATPMVDRLAAEGMRFDRAWTAASNCSPSRGVFYTGKYAHKNGLIGLSNQDWSLPEQERTLVDDLNELGYETVLCGKQHERNTRAGNQQTYRLKGDLMHYDRSICEKGSQPLGTTHDGIRNIVARSTEFLRGRSPDDPPFFLYMAPHEAHSKWDSDESRYAQPSIESIELPAYLPKLEWLKGVYREFLGAVHHADKTLAGFMASIEEFGLAENTIVVFTTDHGESFRRAKGTLYEAAVAVPLIFRWKGVIEPGRVSESLVSNLDLRPTLVAAAGGTPDPDIDGHNLLPVLLGEAAGSRKFLFSERDFHSSYKPMRAVRDDRYKLILNFSSQPDRASLAELADAEDFAQLEQRTGANGRRMPIFELYDLQNDPHETRNLALLPKHRETRQALQDELYRWMNDTGDYLRAAADTIFFPRKSVQRLGR
jgi:N-sulfoglucosamine sulfohydrolase